ncbi:hypothetical protein [Azospirillum brasilense]|uniref:hypothetical protein n=1 Tax=Azospirillum brasilense TaxID=192 RepID=UPI001EDBCABA|nr:hypothetical protein [Azospirillum brasilense]UKJ76544.1 hypothetical protein H1Q64_22615 [Azospirillum brasilense]
MMWRNTCQRLAPSIRAPYLSSAVIVLVGLYVGLHALQGFGITLAVLSGSHDPA